MLLVGARNNVDFADPVLTLRYVSDTAPIRRCITAKLHSSQKCVGASPRVDIAPHV